MYDPYNINPLVTNGLSHPCHLDEPTFILRDIRSSFSFLISFFDEIHVNLGYSVCLCTIKRTPDLYGLILWYICLVSFFL